MTTDLKPENFLILERSLSDRLKKRWAQQFGPIKKRLLAAVKNDDPITAHDIVESLDQLAELHKGMHSYIEYVSTAALLFGASRVRPLNETTLMKGPKRVPPAVKAATKVFEKLLLESRKTIKKIAHQMLNEIERQKVLEHEAELFKADAIKDEQYYIDRIQEAGEGTIDIAASLHTSRLSSYGFLVEAEATNVTEYQIDEVLDSRTCALCNYMHGKTFTVERSLGKVEQVVMVDDPEELKVIAPFFQQTKESLRELHTLSESELQAKGLDMPPFHPGCRGLLAVAGTITEVEPVRITPQDFPDDQYRPADASQETKEKVLGAVEEKRPMTEEEVAAEAAVAEDTILAAELESVGFTGLPRIVEAEEFSALASSRFGEIFRGVQSEAQAEALMSGRLFVGRGAYANGIQATYGPNGLVLAAAYGPKVVSMKLSPNAKVISINQLETIASDLRQDIRQNPEAYTGRALDTYDWVLADMGRLAVYLGFDAIEIASTGTMTILNRTALVIAQAAGR